MYCCGWKIFSIKASLLFFPTDVSFSQENSIFTCTHLVSVLGVVKYLPRHIHIQANAVFILQHAFQNIFIALFTIDL